RSATPSRGRRAILSPKATLSTTVFQGNNPKCWKTIATPARGERIGSPSIRTCPELGVKSPPMQRSKVVLPQPEGPTIHRSSLLLTFSSMLRKATTVPSRKSLLAWSSTILAPSALGRVYESGIPLVQLLPRHPQPVRAEYRSLKLRPTQKLSGNSRQVRLCGMLCSSSSVNLVGQE